MAPSNFSLAKPRSPSGPRECQWKSKGMIPLGSAAAAGSATGAIDSPATLKAGSEKALYSEGS